MRLAFKTFFRNDASFSAGRDRREDSRSHQTNLTYYLERIRDRLAFFGSRPWPSA